MTLFLDVFQPERPDPDPFPDHGRGHARTGADTGRGGGAEGRIQHARDSQEQGPVQVRQKTKVYEIISRWIES